MTYTFTDDELENLLTFYQEVVKNEIKLKYLDSQDWSQDLIPDYKRAQIELEENQSEFNRLITAKEEEYHEAIRNREDY